MFGVLRNLKLKLGTNYYKLNLMADSRDWKLYLGDFWLYSFKWVEGEVRVLPERKIHSVCWAPLAGWWFGELGDCSSLGGVVFLCARRSSGLVFICVRCGVLVFWGMIAGCSTSDVGRDACSFLVYCSLCCGLCPRVETLSLHCYCVFLCGFPCFIYGSVWRVF
jgi:hypothetical protein